jgi:hypothetical protein
MIFLWFDLNFVQFGVISLVSLRFDLDAFMAGNIAEHFEVAVVPLAISHSVCHRVPRELHRLCRLIGLQVFLRKCFF